MQAQDISLIRATWQTGLANVVTDPKELLNLLELDLSWLEAAKQAAKLFPLRVPKGFIARMKKGDIHDPLLQQVLPIGAELIETPGYEIDPLQEQVKNPLPGLLHKYRSRVLFLMTGACAINCRYCFRRHFPYAENNPGTQGWEQVCRYIEQDQHINEVILSGGDPLLANDTTLAKLAARFSTISHLKRLRIHTRLPVVLPERVNQSLLEWLSVSRLQTVVVIHCNHPNELDASVAKAMQQLAQANVTLLNHTVLLKGINDDADVLTELSEKLFAIGVLPYYLFPLDKVQSAAHFDVPEEVAFSLHQAMIAKLPGYLVPRLAREIPGAASKVLLNSVASFPY